jgi:histidinol phosphatase-like enzyme
MTNAELRANAAKVAAFDMDGTLGNTPPTSQSLAIRFFTFSSCSVTPKNPAQKFPSNRNDWAWWNVTVPAELTRLAKEGFHVVIMSNQGGASKGQTTDDTIMGKLFDIAEALGFPFSGKSGKQAKQNINRV